jgi:hypothetical protein
MRMLKHLRSFAIYALSALMCLADAVVAIIVRDVGDITFQKAEMEMAKNVADKSESIKAKPVSGSGSGDSPLKFSALLKAINGHNVSCQYA